MARINKRDHAAILYMADFEECKPAEIAAKYDCTPANIYALLNKLRRQKATEQPPLALDAKPAEPVATRTPAPARIAPPVAAVKPDANVLAFELAPAPEKIAAAPMPRGAPVREAAAPAGQKPVGAKLAKPGVALVMRTADGEESMTPFRSLDDLLSAIKPILRGSARSPDPVWFSLQPIDLSTIDTEAA